MCRFSGYKGSNKDTSFAGMETIFSLSGQMEKYPNWAFEALLPDGKLGVVDTDLERQILRESKSPQFFGRLIPGYLETLVDIEDEFADNLLEDVRQAGFTIKSFDSHEYLDETDAYSLLPDDHIKLKFVGLEIESRKER